MFFKRLSRSRTNSYSNDDDSYERVTSHNTSANAGDQGPPSAYKSHPQYPESPPTSSHDNNNNNQGLNNNPANKMYNARQQDSPATYSSQRPANGLGTRDSGYVDAAPQTPTKPSEVPFTAPDLLTRAFNEAVRPYTDKIEQLEHQLADMRGFVDQMEQQRMDIFSWIDKRGLRPDVPPNIAKQMDSTPDAAASLNAQLDRKITIVNFDLHRLQDDLNDSISSAHFASAMAKFLPDIQRLAHLPSGGPRHAYELLIKLVGNLNSHGGLEASTAGAGDEEVEEDRRSRAAFYERMDNELVEVVGKRGRDGEDWQVSREVKRLEKNAAYLKNLGIEPYFPRTLDVMRQQQQQEYGGGASTPPRYQ